MALGADPEDLGFSFAKANRPPQNPFEAVRPNRAFSAAPPAAAAPSPGRDHPASPGQAPAPGHTHAPAPVPAPATSGTGFTFHRAPAPLSRPAGQPHPLSQSTLPPQPTPPHGHGQVSHAHAHAAPATGWKGQQRMGPPAFGGVGRRPFGLNSSGREQAAPPPQPQPQERQPQAPTPRRPAGVTQPHAAESPRAMPRRDNSTPGRDTTNGGKTSERHQAADDEDEPMLWTIRRDQPRREGRAATVEDADEENEGFGESPRGSEMFGRKEDHTVAVSPDRHQGDYRMEPSPSPTHAQPSFEHQTSSEDATPAHPRPHEPHSLPTSASAPPPPHLPAAPTPQHPRPSSRPTLAGSVRQGQEQMKFRSQDAQPPSDDRTEASPAPAPKRRSEHVQGAAVDHHAREVPVQVQGGHPPPARAGYEGSSEQTLLVLLQQKNGEIDNLRKEAQRLLEVIEGKDQQNDELKRDSQRLAEAYKQDEETWKTSMSNAKKWRDAIKNKELVKTQAAQALNDSYEAQGASIVSALEDLSREAKELKEESIGPIKEDLTQHASSLDTLRQALDDVKREMQGQGNAVEELKSVKALNLHLEDQLVKERKDLAAVSLRNGDLERKVEVFESSLVPSLDKVMGEVAMLRKSSEDSSAEVEKLLEYQHELHEKLSGEVNASEQLRHQIAAVEASRDSLDATIKSSMSHLKALGCEGDTVQNMVDQLQVRYRDELAAAKTTCEIHSREYEHKVALLESKLSGVETQLSESKARTERADEKLKQVEKDFSSKLAAVTAEHKAAEDSLQKYTREYQHNVSLLESKLHGVETQVSESKDSAEHAKEKLKQVEKDLSSKLAAATKEHKAVKDNLQKHTQEYEHNVALLESKLDGVETHLSESKARAEHAHEKLKQVEKDLSSKLAAATAEHKAVKDSLQKELKTAKQEKDRLGRSLEETQAREQGLKDKVTGLTQSSKDALAQLQSAQAGLQGERQRVSSLEQQVEVLQEQLVHATKAQHDTTNLSDQVEALQRSIQEVASSRVDAVELDRIKHEAKSKTIQISHLQTDLDAARQATDKLTAETRKLKNRIEAITAENTGLRESAREREADEGSLLERWDKDELKPEETMLVQKVTQQIKRGEQAFYRQEIDDKSNAVKKLESRCKKLEAQVSTPSHEKLYSGTGQLNRMVTEVATTLSSPLSEPPTSSTAPTPHDSPTRPKTLTQAVALSPSISKPRPGTAIKSSATTSFAKKRQLIDPDEEDPEDEDEPYGHGLGQDDAIDEAATSVPATQYSLPPVKQPANSKPQKRTRFADTIPSDSPEPNPEDADDPIDPPTSQTHSQTQLPPPSQNPKTYKQRGTSSRAIRTRSSLENVGYAGVAEKSGRDKKKARGSRKTA
ncbi:hypothetical protein IAT38_007275 [Cryptococcus sp. DSM 104549]